MEPLAPPPLTEEPVPGSMGDPPVPSSQAPLPDSPSPSLSWHRWLPALLLLTAGALTAFFTTGGGTLDRPLLYPSVLAALLGILATAVRGPQGWGRLLALLALAAAAFAAFHGHLRPGFPIAHDRETHLWGMYAHFQAMQDGDWWPRWNPYLGLGVPLLQYYPPALFYLAALPMAWGASATTAGVMILGASSLATALTHAWGASRLGASRGGAVVAGVAAALAPYRLFDQTYRFAMGEVLGIVIAPLFLVLGWELARKGGRGAILRFSVAASALLLTHALTAMLCGLILGVILIAEGILDGRKGMRALPLSLARLLGGSVLGALLVGAWLIPAATEHRNLALDHYVPGPTRSISRTILAPEDLLRRRRWGIYETSRARVKNGDPRDALPFYFGAVLLGGALGATALGRERYRVHGGSEGKDSSLPSSPPGPRQDPSPPPVPVLGIGLLACLLCTFGVGWPLIQAVGPLRSMQFLWRFLGPASTLAALLLGWGVSRAQEGRSSRAWIPTLVILLLVWDAFPYTGTTGRLPPYQGVVHAIRTRPTTADEQWVDARIPKGEFIRVEQLRYPPSSSVWKVAKTRRAYPEYMARSSYDQYYQPSQKPKGGEKISAEYGVDLRFRDGRKDPDPLHPRSRVCHRSKGKKEMMDLPGASLQILPETLKVSLPEGVAEGRLRVAFSAYDGWLVRVDGGSFAPARSQRGLLAVDIPAGAREVEFYYSLQTPQRRGGLLASAMGALGLLVLVMRTGEGPRKGGEAVPETPPSQEGDST